MHLSKLVRLLLAALLLIPTLAAADILRLGHPERYVVQKGDTLWHIAGHFLNDPWLWPQIWHRNPEIENPHLIYPGDVISLITVDGQLRLTVQRDDRGLPTVRLSPRVREQAVSVAVPTIPLETIRPFLTQTGIVEPRQLRDAPYVLAGVDERVMGSTRDRIYVRGLDPEADTERYVIVRAGETFRDPANRAVLGQAALYLGDAVLERRGDPATVRITGAQREILPGDRLLPAGGEAFARSFTPRPPTGAVDGRIVAVMDGVNQIGQYSVVVIDRGREHELAVGHVLAIYQSGRTVRDSFGRSREEVRLPDERAGELIVFRVFDRLSFALVMRASRAMHTLDAVRNP